MKERQRCAKSRATQPAGGGYRMGHAGMNEGKADRGLRPISFQAGANWDRKVRVVERFGEGGDSFDFAAQTPGWQRRDLAWMAADRDQRLRQGCQPCL